MVIMLFAVIICGVDIDDPSLMASRSLDPLSSIFSALLSVRGKLYSLAGLWCLGD